MFRNYERDDREGWRRQPHNREENWRDEEDYSRRGRDEMDEGFRGQSLQYGGRERGGWQGDRGWERGSQNWQGGEHQRYQGGSHQGSGYRSEGRGWEGEYGMEPHFGRGDWNQGMGGSWNQNQERNRGNQDDWNQKNWNQKSWNQGMSGERENWSERGMQGQHAGRGQG